MCVLSISTSFYLRRFLLALFLKTEIFFIKDFFARMYSKCDFLQVFASENNAEEKDQKQRDHCLLLMLPICFVMSRSVTSPDISNPSE